MRPVIKLKEEEGGGEQAQHAVVALMTSNCCTGVEPHSIDERAKHVVAGVDVFFVFFIVSEKLSFSFSYIQVCIDYRLLTSFF